MKHSEITQFEIKNILPNLMIVKSYFGYFFINDIGAQVQNPFTSEITPSFNDEVWIEHTLIKTNQSPRLHNKVNQIIERISSHYAAVPQRITA